MLGTRNLLNYAVGVVCMGRGKPTAAEDMENLFHYTTHPDKPKYLGVAMRDEQLYHV